MADRRLNRDGSDKGVIKRGAPCKGVEVGRCWTQHAKGLILGGLTHWTVKAESARQACILRTWNLPIHPLKPACIGYSAQLI